MDMKSQTSGRPPDGPGLRWDPLPGSVGLRLAVACVMGWKSLVGTSGGRGGGQVPSAICPPSFW